MFWLSDKVCTRWRDEGPLYSWSSKIPLGWVVLGRIGLRNVELGFAIGGEKQPLMRQQSIKRRRQHIQVLLSVLTLWKRKAVWKWAF